MQFPKSIHINEVGPRDGLQNEKTILSREAKADLINQCILAGFKTIEVGSLVHPKAVPALADTEDVYQLLNQHPDVELRVLVTNLRGVERAINAGIKKVKLTVSASESHNLSNFNRKPEETVQNFKACYELAKANDISVSGAISTAFGCPFEGTISIEAVEKLVLAFIDLGITELSLSDTTGMGNPKEVYDKCLYFKEKYPQVKWNLHFHNTRDMGLSNTLAAMSAGITHFDAAFSGLGGCPYAPGASGNLCTEDLVHMCEEMGIQTGIDLDSAIAIAKEVEALIGHKSESYMLRAGKVNDLAKEKPTQQNN